MTALLVAEANGPDHIEENSMNVLKEILIQIVSDQLSAAITTYVLPLLHAQYVHGFEPLLRAFIAFIW